MTFDQLRERDGAVIAWTIHLQFPAFEGLAELNLYYTTAQNLDIGDGKTYLPLLASVQGRHQKDRGNDYAQFSLLNPKNAIYQNFVAYEDLIEQCRVFVKECVMLEDDFYLTEKRFTGYLTDFTFNDEAQMLDFTCLSDMSRTGFTVGGVILSRERCSAEFAYGGSATPEFELCGWQTIQGGNPVFCTRYLKGQDGCEAHNNEHRFKAVTGIAEAPIQIISNDLNPSGFDYETRECFSQNMFVVMSDWKFKPINQVKIGDSVLGFDLFNGDKLVESEVLNTFSHIVKEIGVATFSKAIIEGTGNHLFYIGNRLFLPLRALESVLTSRTALGLDSKKMFNRSPLLDFRTSQEVCPVFNLHTTSNTFIICDKFKKFFFFVHNAKYEYYQN